MRGGEPIPQSFALSLRDLAKGTRRDPGRAAKRAYEVRQVAEADVVRDVGDRPGIFRQQTGRVTQSATDQVLVRRDTENRGEEAQEVKPAEANLARGSLQIDRLVRVRIQPERRFDGAAAVTRAGVAWLAPLP